MFVAKATPPTSLANQFTVKPGAVAVRMTVPVLHLDAEVAIGADGINPTAPVTATLAEIQPVVSFLLCT